MCHVPMCGMKNTRGSQHSVFYEYICNFKVITVSLFKFQRWNMLKLMFRNLPKRKSLEVVKCMQSAAQCFLCVYFREKVI